MKLTECSQFRMTIHELFVDPQSAPLWLKGQWQTHQKVCESCHNFFEKTQKEQELSHETVIHLSLDDELRAIMVRGSQKEQDLWQHKTYKRSGDIPIRWLWTAAAVLLVGIAIYLAPWKDEPDRGTHKHRSGITFDKENISIPIDASDEERHLRWKLLEDKLLRCFRDEQRGLPEKNPEQGIDNAEYVDLDFMAEKVSSYLAKIDGEFAALEELVGSYDNSSQSSILAEHLRFTLVDVENHSKLSMLQANGYPVREIKVLFVQSIPNISGNAEFEEEATDFFRKASPHIFNIWSSRSDFMESIGKQRVENFGGKEKFLNLIGNIENSVCF